MKVASDSPNTSDSKQLSEFVVQRMQTSFPESDWMCEVLENKSPQEVDNYLKNLNQR